uniref:Uncharacterized protein n=1 Tax=Salix viminalis TaxID=40686 RepID=A0A6N2MD01_SALVM
MKANSSSVKTKKGLRIIWPRNERLLMTLQVKRMRLKRGSECTEVFLGQNSRLRKAPLVRPQPNLFSIVKEDPSISRTAAYFRRKDFTCILKCEIKSTWCFGGDLYPRKR